MTDNQTATAAVEDAPVYDASSIRTLDSLEHIRIRPGMYIGQMGTGSHPGDGIYILLKEVVDNCIDEIIMGHGRRIDITLDDATGKVAVRDYGRGIPLEAMIACVSKINTGGKYSTGAFKFSIGLNGVGLKAVNALSAEFTVRSCREGKFRFASFARASKSASRASSRAI